MTPPLPPAADAAVSDFDAADTSAFSARRVAFAGALLLAAGLICWTAANWFGLHRAVKIGGAGLLVALGCALAAGLPRWRAPALAFAIGAQGALLAVLGQTYPSGAKEWALFAIWTALAAPLAFAARRDALWALWAAIYAFALCLWRFQSPEAESAAGFLFAGGLAASLAVAAASGLAARLARAELDKTFAVCAITAVFYAFTWALSERLDMRSLPALAMLLGLFGWFWTRRKDSLTLLVVAGGALLAVLIWRLAEPILRHIRLNEAGLIVIGLLAAAALAGALAALRRYVDRKGGGSAARWPLAALALFGALLAAAPLALAYGLAFNNVAPENHLIGAVLALAGALGLLAGGATFGFRQSFGLVLAVLGLALTAFARLETGPGFAVATAAAALAIGAALLGPSWASAIFGFLAVGALFAERLETLPLVLAVAAGLYATGPRFGAAAGRFGPAFSGAAFATLWLWVAGRAMDIGLRGRLSSPALAFEYSLIVAALALAGAFLLRPQWRRAPAFAAAAGALALCGLTPGLVGAVVVFVVAALTGRGKLAWLALASGLLETAVAYYDLGWPLDRKGAVLAGAGLLLLIGAAPGLRAAPGPGREASGGAVFGRAGLAILAGLLLTLGLAGWRAATMESLRANGREVFIALQPRDPRALMMGDYMTLNVVPREIQAIAGDDDGVLLVPCDVDARRVAVCYDPANAPAAGPGVTRLTIQAHGKPRHRAFGSDAWFFEEGKAATFDKAAYGLFRVGPAGEVLLTGLADKDLRELK